MQEEVDNVQVEVYGGQHVLLRGQLVHEEVGVVDDEGAEEESTSPGIHQLQRVVVEEELQWSLGLEIDINDMDH